MEKIDIKRLQDAHEGNSGANGQNADIGFHCSVVNKHVGRTLLPTSLRLLISA